MFSGFFARLRLSSFYADMASGKLVLIIGPSGVGKSVILQSLRQRHPEFVFPRSATTRDRRPQESDDLYHFVTEEEFSLWLSEEKFLEWAQVHHGARYGTLLSEIVPFIEAGKNVVREVDVQEFRSIRKHPLFKTNGGRYPLRTIFILPESEEQLVTHITERAPIADNELKRRIESMKNELAIAPETDMQIQNREGKLPETIAQVEEAIFT